MIQENLNHTFSNVEKRTLHAAGVFSPVGTLGNVKLYAVEYKHLLECLAMPRSASNLPKTGLADTGESARRALTVRDYTPKTVRCEPTTPPDALYLQDHRSTASYNRLVTLNSDLLDVLPSDRIARILSMNAQYEAREGFAVKGEFVFIRTTDGYCWYSALAALLIYYGARLPTDLKKWAIATPVARQATVDFVRAMGDALNFCVWDNPSGTRTTGDPYRPGILLTATHAYTVIPKSFIMTLPYRAPNSPYVDADVTPTFNADFTMPMLNDAEVKEKEVVAKKKKQAKAVKIAVGAPEPKPVPKAVYCLPDLSNASFNALKKTIYDTLKAEAKPDSKPCTHKRDQRHLDLARRLNFRGINLDHARYLTSKFLHLMTVLPLCEACKKRMYARHYKYGQDAGIVRVAIAIQAYRPPKDQRKEEFIAGKGGYEPPAHIDNVLRTANEKLVVEGAPRKYKPYASRGLVVSASGVVLSYGIKGHIDRQHYKYVAEIGLARSEQDAEALMDPFNGQKKSPHAVHRAIADKLQIDSLARMLDANKLRGTLYIHSLGAKYTSEFNKIAKLAAGIAPGLKIVYFPYRPELIACDSIYNREGEDKWRDAIEKQEPNALLQRRAIDKEPFSASTVDYIYDCMAEGQTHVVWCADVIYYVPWVLKTKLEVYGTSNEYHVFTGAIRLAADEGIASINSQGRLEVDMNGNGRAYEHALFHWRDLDPIVTYRHEYIGCPEASVSWHKTAGVNVEFREVVGLYTGKLDVTFMTKANEIAVRMKKADKHHIAAALPRNETIACQSLQITLANSPTFQTALSMAKEVWTQPSVQTAARNAFNATREKVNRLIAGPETSRYQTAIDILGALFKIAVIAILFDNNKYTIAVAALLAYIAICRWFTYRRCIKIAIYAVAVLPEFVSVRLLILCAYLWLKFKVWSWAIEGINRCLELAENTRLIAGGALLRGRYQDVITKAGPSLVAVIDLTTRATVSIAELVQRLKDTYKAGARVVKDSATRTGVKYICLEGYKLVRYEWDPTSWPNKLIATFNRHLSPKLKPCKAVIAELQTFWEEYVNRKLQFTPVERLGIEEWMEDHNHWSKAKRAKYRRAIEKSMADSWAPGKTPVFTAMLKSGEDYYIWVKDKGLFKRNPKVSSKARLIWEMPPDMCIMAYTQKPLLQWARESFEWFGHRKTSKHYEQAWFRFFSDKRSEEYVCVSGDGSAFDSTQRAENIRAIDHTFLRATLDKALSLYDLPKTTMEKLKEMYYKTTAAVTFAGPERKKEYMVVVQGTRFSGHPMTTLGNTNCTGAYYLFALHKAGIPEEEYMLWASGDDSCVFIRQDRLEAFRKVFWELWHDNKDEDIEHGLGQCAKKFDVSPAHEVHFISKTSIPSGRGIKLIREPKKAITKSQFYKGANKDYHSEPKMHALAVVNSECAWTTSLCWMSEWIAARARMAKGAVLSAKAKAEEAAKYIQMRFTGDEQHVTRSYDELELLAKSFESDPHDVVEFFGRVQSVSDVGDELMVPMHFLEADIDHRDGLSRGFSLIGGGSTATLHLESQHSLLTRPKASRKGA